MRDQFAPVIEGFHCDGITNPWSFQSESFYEDGGNGGTMLDGTTVQDVLAVKNRFSWALNVLTMSQYNALIAALDSGSEPDTVSATVFDPATDTRYTTTFHVTPPAFRFVPDISGETVAIPDSTLVLEETGEGKTIIRVIASGDGWTLTSDGLLDVYFDGNMPDYEFSRNVPWGDYKAQITRVIISDNVTSIGSKAFFDCDNLTSIIIPNSVTRIGDEAFWNCHNLTSVTMPNSMTSIGTHAFSHCYALLDIAIPDGVTRIEEYTFFDCRSMTSITIPSSVTHIGLGAFFRCRALRSIIIPYGVTSIEGITFLDCNSLTSVTIPVSVTSIGITVFVNCDALTDVYYGGTETQWNDIEIGDYNNSLKNATIHYNSTGPT